MAEEIEPFNIKRIIIYKRKCAESKNTISSKYRRLPGLPAIGRGGAAVFLSPSAGAAGTNLYGALKALACKWV